MGIGNRAYEFSSASVQSLFPVIGTNIHLDRENGVAYVFLNDQEIFDSKIIYERIISASIHAEKCIVINEWKDLERFASIKYVLPSMLASLVLETNVCMVLQADENVCLQAGNHSKTSVKERQMINGIFTVDLDFIGNNMRYYSKRIQMKNIMKLLSTL